MSPYESISLKGTAMSETQVATVIKQAKQLFNSKRRDEAIDLLQQALDKDPDLPDVHSTAATMHFMAQNYDQAIEHFKRTTQLLPSEAAAFINLGAVYNRMGDYKNAVDVLQKGIQKNSKSADGYYNLGIAQRKLGQQRMAITAYRECLRLAPDMAEAHQNLANVYMDLNNPDKAMEHYKEALRIKPGFERAVRGLDKARSAAQVGMVEENPFGRLVDENQLKKRGDDESGVRQLSELERQEDSEFLYTLSERIVETSEEVLEILTEDVEPTLLALSRTVAQGAATTHLVYDDHTEFRQAVNDMVESRKLIKAQLAELKRHEDELKIK